MRTLVEVSMVLAPLVVFQRFGFQQFCEMSSDVGQPGNSLSSRGSTPAWCAARVPYLYGHVQRHYWGVGFLQYFDTKQVMRPLNTLWGPQTSAQVIKCDHVYAVLSVFACILWHPNAALLVNSRCLLSQSQPLLVAHRSCWIFASPAVFQR